MGVKLTIGSDAHAAENVGRLAYGVVTAADVINTWPLERVLAWAGRAWFTAEQTSHA